MHGRDSPNRLTIGLSSVCHRGISVTLWEELLLTEYTEKTQKLQQVIADLETEQAEKSAMVNAIHEVLNRVQGKLFYWSQQYFACEPKALSEVEELYQEIDQAIASPTSRSKNENSNT